MVLVFAREPYAMLTIDDKPVPGYLVALDPCNLPFKVYHRYRKMLTQAPYTNYRLAKLFNLQVPSFVYFRYSDILTLPQNMSDAIANALGIKSDLLKLQNKLIQKHFRWH